MAVFRGAVRIRDNRRKWDKLRAVSKTRPSVIVGVREPNANRPGSNIDNVGLMNIHEFGATVVLPGGGTFEIPERSVIRATMDENADKYRRSIRRLARAVYTQTIDEQTALDLLGLQIQADMRERIQNGIEPPLSPRTIAQKTVNGLQGTTPLIAIAQLIGSIDYETQKGA